MQDITQEERYGYIRAAIKNDLDSYSDLLDMRYTAEEHTGGDFAVWFASECHDFLLLNFRKIRNSFPWLNASEREVCAVLYELITER